MISRQSVCTVPVAEDVALGGDQVIMMAGPCSVESYGQMRAAAEAVTREGIRILRGGAFKPRTSPDSFQGLGQQGLAILRDVADEFGLLVVTEALAVADVPMICDYADILQIGSRNMQHFPLLWSVGETEKPILLKRGFMSTIDEWLRAADHIASRGNNRIILCERGIRTFETASRNTLDVNGIALAKSMGPYPVIADPSHATGRADLVLPAARAAIAAGADGLLVEFHPDPELAWSDGQQSLPLSMLPQFMDEVGQVARAVGRSLT